MSHGRVLIAMMMLVAAGGSVHYTSFAAEGGSAVVARVASRNAIEDITSVQQGAFTVVRIRLRDPLAIQPAMFSTTNPARLAIDLAGTVNATGASWKELGAGSVRSAAVVQVEDRTRVVLNLSEAMRYEAAVDGAELTITLASSAAPAELRSPNPTRASMPVKRFAEDTGSAAHRIESVDFRRGPGGEGRIVVDLSDGRAGIDIRQQGQTLLVDFPRAALAAEMRRKLNVGDFGTAVKSVTTTDSPDGVRMTIEPEGLWEYNAYQSENRFVIEVRAASYDPRKLVQGTGEGYRGDKLSLNFQNVDVRNILNVIADHTKLNIIASDSVQGTLTLRLQDVPWDHALDIILQTRGLDMRKNGSVIWVAPRDEIAKREKDALETRNQLADLEPLRTESFQLNYTPAAEVLKILTNDKQRVLSKRGSAVIDERTNQVFVQDNAGQMEQVRAMIAKIDVPVRQVQIEARIVEAGDSFSRSLGARLGFSGTRPWNVAGQQALIGGGIGKALQSSGQLPGGTTSYSPSDFNVNLPASSINGNAAGNLSMVLFNTGATRFLNLELSALEADGRGKIVSSPRVVTADQVEALIEQGTELPYQQASASGATAVSFRKASLSLKVKPQITPDGHVVMRVDINKDAPGQPTPSGIAIDTKHIQTQVMVENGGTVVIGGIYTQEERTDVNKVPLLGDIPVAGHLFRNTALKDNKTELLVFLTPRIIDNRMGGAK